MTLTLSLTHLYLRLCLHSDGIRSYIYLSRYQDLWLESISIDDGARYWSVRLWWSTGKSSMHALELSHVLSCKYINNPGVVADHPRSHSQCSLLSGNVYTEWSLVPCKCFPANWPLPACPSGRLDFEVDLSLHCGFIFSGILSMCLGRCGWHVKIWNQGIGYNGLPREQGTTLIDILETHFMGWEKLLFSTFLFTLETFMLEFEHMWV